MSDTETNLKLTIDAEYKAQAAVDAAKKHIQELIDKQKELRKRLDEDTQAEIRGDKAKMMSIKEWQETTRQVQTGIQHEITKATNLQLFAEAQLETAKKNHAKAAKAANDEHIKSIHGVTGALTHYLKHFVSLAAAEEVIRRSIDEYAKWERGMARIEIQTGKTSKGVEHIAHSIDVLARMTGISVAELQKNFLTFQAGIGEMNHDVEHAFEDIVKVSYAAGVSVDSMSRTAVAAIKTMNVPYSELKEVLGTVAREIPASAMGAWDNVAPKILFAMRSIGGEGAASVNVAAQAFGILNKSLGDGQTAANVYSDLMKKAADQSTLFGKVMTPMLGQMQRNGASATEQFEAMYQQYERMGAFNDDPSRALFFQQQLRISPETAKGLQDAHKLYQQIVDKAAEMGSTFKEAEAVILRLNRGPKQAIDDLTGSIGELLVALGKFLGPTIPDTLTGWVKSLTLDVERFNTALEKWRELIGAKKPDAEETPYRVDPGGWLAQLAGFGTLDEQREHARTAPGLSPGKAGYGVEDMIWNWLLGENDPGNVRRRAQRGIQPNTPGVPRGVPPRLGSSTATPSTAPRPGYATGGEFVVPGQGGRDTQPVDFMATPGERVAITTPMQESLQQQQDKADLAMREHFARFRTRTAARGGADWWPGSQARAPGPGEGGATPGGASREGTGGGPSGGGRGGGGGGGDTTTTPDPNAAYNALPAYARAAPGEAAAGLHRGRVAQRERPVPGGGQPGTVQPGGVLPPGGAVFDLRNTGGVNATLVAAVRAGAEFLPAGYRVVVTSGHRHTGRPTSNHRRGLALDIQIIRPDGTRIKNYGERRLDPRDADPSGLYGQISRVAYGYLLRNHPDQASKFAWGASFPIPQGGAWHQHPDTMHYSLNNEHGRWSQYRPSNMGPLYPGEPVPGQPSVAGAGTRPAAAGAASQYTAAVAAGTANAAQTYAEFRRLAVEAGSPNPDLTAALAMHEVGCRHSPEEKRLHQLGAHQSVWSDWCWPSRLYHGRRWPEAQGLPKSA